MSDALSCPGCYCRNAILKTKSHGLKVFECIECSLVFVWPLLQGGVEDTSGQKSSITDDGYYSNIINNHDAQVSLANAKVPYLLAVYVEILKRNPKSILEFGCGTGQYFAAWKERGIQWTGVEVNKKVLNFCRDKNKPVASFDEFLNEDGKFDVIFMSQVLEHVLDPNEFLRLAYSKLEPGGILHIDVPNHNGLNSRFRKLKFISKDYGFIQPEHHLIAYTEKSLSSLLKKLNFNIVNIFAKTNDDPVYGQLIVDASLLFKLTMHLGGFLGMGSLLVCIAQKPLETSSAE